MTIPRREICLIYLIYKQEDPCFCFGQQIRSCTTICVSIIVCYQQTQFIHMTSIYLAQTLNYFGETTIFQFLHNKLTYLFNTNNTFILKHRDSKHASHFFYNRNDFLYRLHIDYRPTAINNKVNTLHATVVTIVCYHTTNIE